MNFHFCGHLQTKQRAYINFRLVRCLCLLIKTQHSLLLLLHIEIAGCFQVLTHRRIQLPARLEFQRSFSQRTHDIMPTCVLLCDVCAPLTAKQHARTNTLRQTVSKLH
jgi:hypothetical protein